MNYRLTGTFLHEVFFSNYARFYNINILRLVRISLKNFFERIFISKETVGGSVITLSLWPKILKKKITVDSVLDPVGTNVLNPCSISNLNQIRPRLFHTGQNPV